MEIDGKRLVEGKFFLWKVATQQGTDIDLHSVYFITNEHTDNKPDIYEVVFTRPKNGDQNSSWYLVKKNIALEIEKEAKTKEVVEGEVINKGGNPDTLEISVSDEMKLGEMLSGG